MIKHVVCFKLSDNSQEKKQETKKIRFLAFFLGCYRSA